MRIPSGVTDQYVYFIAVDSTDLTTRETGLTTFTVYRSRNGAAAAAMTTPTINEVDATNMPGVYELLLDEDMTIGSGNDSEAMVFHITQASMAPVTLEIELYRPKITAGNTLGVASDGDVSGNVDGNVVGSVASVSGAVGSVTGAVTVGTINANVVTASSIAASALNGKGDWNIGKTGYTVSTVSDKTGYSISGTITTLDGLNDPTAAAVADAVWDEPMSGHTTSGTFGEYLNEQIVASGTMQAGSTSTTAVLAAATAFADDVLIGSIILITGGTGAGQSNIINDWVSATDTATVARTWAVTPDNTSTYLVFSLGAVTLTAAEIADAVLDEALSGHATAGTLGKAISDIETDATTILADTADIQPKLGTVSDLGGGTTLAANLSDMAGATFSTSTDSQEALRNRGDTAWITGAGGTPPQLLQSTTIATLASQTSFTLTAGSADDDAYNDAIAVITDSATSTQKAVGTVSDYTGATKTVTLSADPAIFTMAAGDTIEIIAALGAAGSAPSAAQVADAVLDEALSGHATAGTLGKAIADIETDATAILADTNELQTDDVPGLIAALNNISAADVNAQCDTAIADAALATAAALATVDGIVDAILVDTGTTLPATLATIDTVADGIQTDLSNGTDGLGALKALIDTVDTVVDAIKAKTDSLTFTVANQVDANIQSVNDTTVTGDGGSGTEWGP